MNRLRLIKVMGNSKKILNKALFILTAVIAFLIASCNHGGGQRAADKGMMSPDTGMAGLVFTEYEHDFGNVTEGEKVAYIFTFKNSGTSDLVIESATTSCGCTVPDFDKKPVGPDREGKMEVVFDTSGRNGRQTKTITVRSNAATPVVLLKITAVVINRK